MIPSSFDYHAPTSVDEALGLLGELGGDARVLAGGHSLVPAMRLRLAMPGALVDLNRIAGLSYIKEEGGELRIGAMTREVELERSALVQERYPLLADAGRVIADPLVRNRGTIGGNLAHADPANDHPAGMDVKIEGALHTHEWDGRTWYFCCDGCRAKFATDPEAWTAA